MRDFTNDQTVDSSLNLLCTTSIKSITKNLMNDWIFELLSVPVYDKCIAYIRLHQTIYPNSDFLVYPQPHLFLFQNNNAESVNKTYVSPVIENIIKLLFFFANFAWWKMRTLINLIFLSLLRIESVSESLLPPSIIT